MPSKPEITTPAHPQKTIQYFDGVGNRREVTRTWRQFNDEFPIESKHFHLHHLMEDSEYYRDMMDAFVEEIRYELEKRVHPKNISFDPRYYTDPEDYEDRLRNMSQLLDNDPDYYLIPYLFETQSAATEWQKWDIESVPFMHKWRNSYRAYKFIFSRIWMHGGMYLELFYPEGQGTGVLNEFTDKAVRLVDNSDVMSNWLPPLGNWPNPGYVTGLRSYNAFQRLYAFRFDDRAEPEFDTGTESSDTIDSYGFDPNSYRESQLSGGDPEGPEDPPSYDVDVDPVFFFDTRNFPLVRDRTLVLSLTADRIFNRQRNTLNTSPPDCLCDIPFLQYVQRQAQIHKKITERLKVGVQLSLACDESGEFVKSGDSAHTIPNIRANVVILPRNYEANPEPARVRLGTGVPSDALANALFRRPTDFQKHAVYGESSAYDWSTYTGPDIDRGDPEDLEEIEERERDVETVDVDTFRMVRPIFGTALGEFEVNDVTANMRGINTLIERQSLEGPSEQFTIRFEETDGPDRDPAAIGFPHEFIAFGSFEGLLSLESLYIRIGASLIDPETASITLTDKYIPVEDFLFSTSSSDGYDIVPRLLFDYETLSYFGGHKQSLPSDLQDGWVELIEALNNGYRWVFSDLIPPSREEDETTLKDFLLSLDPEEVTIQDEVEDFLLDGEEYDPDSESFPSPRERYGLHTGFLDYIQDWVENENIWVTFYPVQDYNEEGKALPLDEDDYLSDAELNLEGGSFIGANWYKWIPQYLWRVWGEFEEGINDETGLWEPTIQYRVFNEFTFREALRFIGDEPDETTLSTDFSSIELQNILSEFFLTLGADGLYAATPYNEDFEYNDVVADDRSSFFDPMFTGGLDDIPRVIKHNHIRVDKEWSFTAPPQGDPEGEPIQQSGIDLNLDNGTLRFQVIVPSSEDFDKAYDATLNPDNFGSNTIDERLPRESIQRTMVVRYVTNTTTDFADVDDIDSRVVGIREAGIFNTEDELIAYATFPPVIYDSFHNHFALNWYISTFNFVAP